MLRVQQSHLQQAHMHTMLLNLLFFLSSALLLIAGTYAHSSVKKKKKVLQMTTYHRCYNAFCLMYSLIPGLYFFLIIIFLMIAFAGRHPQDTSNFLNGILLSLSLRCTPQQPVTLFSSSTSSALCKFQGNLNRSNSVLHPMKFKQV